MPHQRLVLPARAGFGGEMPKGKPGFWARIPSSVGNARACPVQTMLGGFELKQLLSLQILQPDGSNLLPVRVRNFE
jgi:hypothetical protein